MDRWSVVIFMATVYRIQFSDAKFDYKKMVFGAYVFGMLSGMIPLKCAFVMDYFREILMWMALMETFLAPIVLCKSKKVITCALAVVDSLRPGHARFETSESGECRWNTVPSSEFGHPGIAARHPRQTGVPPS